MQLWFVRLLCPLIIALSLTSCFGRVAPLSIAGPSSGGASRLVPGRVAQLVSPAPLLHGSLAGRTKGFIAAWGANNWAQLGKITRCSSCPVPMPGPGQAIQLAGSYETTVALRPDGTVWEWGRSDTSAQCGVLICSPTRVPGLTGVVAVADAGGIFSGEDQRWALKSDGTVWTWGGSGHVPIRPVIPVPVGGLAHIVQVAAASVPPSAGILGQILALKDGGSVWQRTWACCSSLRSTPFRQVSSLGHVTAIASGVDHALALGADHRVWSWVYPKTYGRASRTPPPRPVRGEGGAGYLRDITAIAAGYGFSLAADSHGAVWAWGTNSRGELGTGMGGKTPLSTARFPARISGLAGIVAVAAGQWHGLALGSSGTIWGWGGNEAGETGVGFVSTSRKSACRCVDLPTQVPGIHDALGIAAGPIASFALTRTTVPLAPPRALPPCSLGGASSSSTPGTSTAPLDAASSASDSGRIRNFQACERAPSILQTKTL